MPRKWFTAPAVLGLVGLITLGLWDAKQNALESAAAEPPPKTVTAPYTPGGFQAGVGVMFYSADYDHAKGLPDLAWKVEELLDRLVEANVNSVSLNWPIYTDGVRPSRVYRGEGTPPDEAIRFFVREAAGRGFAVALRPIIDEKNIVPAGRHEWRGTIRPRNPSAWFKSYGALMFEYAKIAHEEGAKIMMVGVELTSMEQYAGEWRTLVEKVRAQFSGELSYSSNRGISKEMPWEALDFISVDAFFELKTPQDATAKDMVRAWAPWVVQLQKEAEAIGKPLVLSELGATSQRGAHRRTWVWDHKSPLNLEDQRRFYAASCAIWKPRAKGIYWWVANVWMPAEPLKDAGFTPMGKPAEREIALCYE